jgi:hypothetical protein
MPSSYNCLSEKIKTLEASLFPLKAGSLQAQQHRKNLEEQLKAKTKEMLTVKAQFGEYYLW